VTNKDKSGWVDVKEKMPKNNECVQVYNSGINGGYQFGQFMFNGYSWQVFDYRDGYREAHRPITHWQPLPADIE